jgi:DNA-binding transcriptional regulator YhcF (GntR family)
MLAELAVEFDVAPMTILQVLARLEDEGCIMREQDRGTFAPERVVPKVLIVDDEAATRKLVVSQVRLSRSLPRTFSGGMRGDRYSSANYAMWRTCRF